MCINKIDENRALRLENRILWIALSAVAVMMLFMVFISITASASAIDDIADGVNDGLFDGKNLYATEAILTASVMFGGGIVLAMLRLPMTGVFIVLFVILGALTAIGWADITFILVAALIATGLFGKRTVEWITGSGGNNES